MIQLLAPLLGGLGGLLFPAAAGAAAGGAAATGIGALLAKGALPALGAGLGTLVSGGNGKDAIRNALLMGVGVNAFPGLAGKIQGSGFGQSVTEGLASIFGGGTQQAPMTSPRPIARPRGASESGLATMSPVESIPERGGFGTPGDRQGPMNYGGMSTIPSLSEMSREAFENAQDMGMGFPNVPSSQIMAEYASREAFENAQDMGMGEPQFMPITGDLARNRDLQRALDMAAVEASRFDDIRDVISERGSSPGLRYAGDKYINRLTDLLDISNRRARGLRGFAMGGEIEGPGTGTSDSIPADIYQDGKRVQKAALSDGEFVMTADAVKGAGNGSRERGVSRMYELMRRFESGEMA